ncbi:MAG TPA: trypsin-like peptidase domain-containing protein [Thermoleophilaceae bacterium]|nr:trypsin-like peptidase domain-containing protein [Thermoleophilaceae bacterium]
MTKTSPATHLLAGVAGGLLVLIAGVVLLLTGAIDTGGDETPSQVATQPVAQPESGGGREDAGGEELTVHEIYERTSPGVVFVQAEGVTGDSPLGLPGGRGTASGSGFVLDRDGFVLTNGHVVDGAKDVTVTFSDDEEVSAEVVGADLSSDLAVLKVDPGEVDLTPLELGDSSEVEVGDAAIAIGNPFGFDRTITTGIVSAIQRNIQAPNGFSIDDVLQTDASINPGNSGGPLLDARGRVIGINAQIATGGARGSVGIGFAVPVDTAKEVIPQLQEDGEIKRAFLGVSTTDVTESLAEEADLPAEEGALVVEVIEGGPADEAGLEPARIRPGGAVRGGDIIVSVDGEEVTESAEVAEAVTDKAPGDTVEIEVLRDGGRETIEAELDVRPDEAESADVPGGGGGGGGGRGDGLPFPLP